jgi:hypothetical protein
MTTNEHIETSTLALLDQVIAGSVDYLDGLISAYRQTLGEARSRGTGDVWTVVACAATLRQEVPVEVLAGTLAVALMRLADGQASHG